METRELLERSKSFALRIVKLADALPKTLTGRNIGNQIIRSGTSVVANYRAAQRARSRAEFISKVGIVLEESDETLFWLEFIVDAKLMKQSMVGNLIKESNELTAIFCSIINSAKKKKDK